METWVRTAVMLLALRSTVSAVDGDRTAIVTLKPVNTAQDGGFADPDGR